ncbi:hypothetical protein FNAPI_6743 [Fusarium napiforme]|uniref:Uncharacterized protein n=1 Tax=Fusarium napiforme TaxID=42672 RepID=A0A8H5JF55_9HYPO|nr:hypothetical protein FNAPI_6743 [Fusarium napiforme]
MDNKRPTEKDILYLQNFYRRIGQPFVMTPNGPMPCEEDSTFQKVSELKVIAVVAGGILRGLRLQSPSGETGNMVAPSDLAKDAFIYQGSDAGIHPAIRSTVLGTRSRTAVDHIPLPITNKDLMESERPDGYRKIEVKFSLVDRREVNSQNKGRVEILQDAYDKGLLIFPYDDALVGPGSTKALMLEEVVDGGEGTGACWVVDGRSGA